LRTASSGQRSQRAATEDVQEQLHRILLQVRGQET
jgi:hypothetical protein